MKFSPIKLVQHIEADLPLDPASTEYYDGIIFDSDIVAWRDESRTFPEIHAYILPKPVVGLDEVVDITDLSPISLELNADGLNEPLDKLAGMPLSKLIRYLA
ncbi:hypothetical protein M3221_00435 [Domibacillus indicus]|uniref:hypothetical protein n=1 Tax=Domibacillus indicus TaxID=1437523 RepID=UPI00203FB4FD|nr:hypothetical protein [Domibacillus indicus]MCM3786897.1 hypothetical protein [Domibacillus indicus]